MAIGEVIRRYRKEKHLTQEEIANYLGITAPAVNKWENGNSCPDITLLAPLARLLGISTDTLLSYKEELTAKEINQIIETVNAKLHKEDYDQAFRWSLAQIQQYPNCDQLIFLAAQLLDSYRTIMSVAEPQKYDAKIVELYLQALNSNDQVISQSAALALFNNSLGRKDYDLAQQYLNRIPRQQVNTKRFQAALLAKQDKIEEAYELYEQLLFAAFGDLSWALIGLYNFAVKENDLAQAERLADKLQKLAELLEMGKFLGSAPRLELAVLKKDKEAALATLADMLDGLQDINSLGSSSLYSHIQFSSAGAENIAFMLQKGFEDDSEFAFLKDDSRYQQLRAQLQRLTQK